MKHNINDQVIIKDDNCKLYGIIISIEDNNIYVVNTMFGDIRVIEDKIVFNMSY